MLYNLGIRLYGCALRVAALRNRKAALMCEGRRHTLQLLREKVQPGNRYIWIHAASLGEFEQGRPLIERIRSRHPDYKIALTFYSPSGYEVRKNYIEADIVAYLPLDTPAQARRFLDTLRPEKAIFVKYEFWRNFLRELHRRQIPTYLVSAIFRPDQLFFKPGGKAYSSMLKLFTHIFVQDKESIRLLSGVGVTAASVAGDTRFDRVTDIMRTTVEIPVIERFTKGNTRMTMIFGSSWEADEAVYFPWLKSTGSGLKSIIAPHEFSPERLAKMRSQLQPELRVVLMSEAKENPQLVDNADCLIMDCFGLLSSAYRYADLAYIGGGFGAGIHNINEAAVYGIPVVFGPRYDKFLEAREIIKAGGGFSVDNAEKFLKLMESPKKGLHANTEARKKSGEKAGQYIKSKLGASDFIMPRIFPENS